MAETNPHQPLIALATGGTGGHVFPAEALARSLGEQGYRLALITDSRGDKFSGALGQIDRHTINAGTVTGRGLLGRIGAVFRLGMGFLQARALLKSLKPAAVVGFGGYPSVPTMLAASMLPGIRTVIHEQNAVLGRANRLLAPRMDKIATSFNKTDLLRENDRTKTVWTGNPVRAEIVALSGQTYPTPATDAAFHILIVGGSQGAQVFGEIVPEAVFRLSDTLRQRLRIVQQTREDQVGTVRSLYQDMNVNAEVSSFFNDMPGQLDKAHLLICRAGASTIAELITAGRPAVLVPYPYAIDDHQTQNAARLSDSAGGWMLPEDDLGPDRLAARLTELMEGPNTLAVTAAAAQRIAMPEAAENLAEQVISLIGKTHKQNTNVLGKEIQT